MDKYEYWFACMPGVGNAKKRKLREGMKTAEELYYIEETKLTTNGLNEKEIQKYQEHIRQWKLDEEYQKMLEKGVHCTNIFDKEYPKRLLQVSSAPYAIFWKGELPEEEHPTVAIVGARDCSA